MSSEGPSPSTADWPLAVVAMPIYNEAEHVEQALRALMAQDYANLQIVVSDNASTDGSADLCELVAGDDPRVRIERLSDNIGAAANFRRVLDGAQGKYFMWAGGHDLWSPNLVSASVTMLENNPDAVVAVASSRWIDADGVPMTTVAGYSDTRGLHPLARFFTVLWGNMHPVLGVMRLEALRRTEGIQGLTGADLVLLCDLVLRGHFVHVDRADWSRREVRANENQAGRLKRYAGSEYGLARGWLDKFVPLVRLPFALAKVLLNAESLAPLDRLLAIAALFGSLPVRYSAGKR